MQPRDITKEIEELNNTYDYTKSYMNDRLKITIRKYKKENKYEENKYENYLLSLIKNKK